MRIRRMLVLAVVAALVLGACGGDDDEEGTSPAAETEETAETTTTTIDEAAATAEITANFEAFFDGQKPPEEKVPLLEDGEALRQTLIAGTTGPNADLARRTTTKVQGVEFLTAEACDIEGITAPCAKVTHDLVLDGTQVALAGQKSYAVYVDGKWKLSKISYCGLVALGGATPEECK